MRLDVLISKPTCDVTAEITPGKGVWGWEWESADYCYWTQQQYLVGLFARTLSAFLSPSSIKISHKIFMGDVEEIRGGGRER